MRRIVVSEFVSLDGVMEDPGGSEKSMHGGWVFRHFSPEHGRFKFEELFACDAMLLGRVTYEVFAASWPAMKDPEGFADRMNGMPKHVVSGTLTQLDWQNSSLLKGDLEQSVRALKAEPGQDLLVVGSATLVRTLLELGLVDELRLMVFPEILGGGRRLFEEGSGSGKLERVGTRTLGSGTVLLTYRPSVREA